MKKTKYNMGLKRGLFLFIFLFSVMFSLSLISALTLDTPVASDTISGTYHFNVTAAEGELQTGITNCTIDGSSSLTANSTTTTFATGTNSSENVTVLNVSTNLAWDQIEDSNDYSFAATCSNLTNSVATSSVTITINNTAPGAATSLYPSSNLVNTNGSIDFSSAVVGGNVTGCTLFFVNGPNYNGKSQSMTHSGNTCTLSLSSVPENTYNYIVQTSDGTELANTSSLSFTVDQKSSSGAVALLSQQRGTTVGPDGKTLTIAPEGAISGWSIAIILILVVVVWFFFFRKK